MLIPDKKVVFVFGSNEAGKHGAGAALHARIRFGAVYGEGEGRNGNSFALPTKDKDIHTLPLPKIKARVNHFMLYAGKRLHEIFMVTAIGCGRAGLTPEQMVPLFFPAPENCWFDDKQWQSTFEAVEITKKYWGTYIEETEEYKYNEAFKLYLIETESEPEPLC